MLFAPSPDPLALTLLVLPETSLMTLAATVDPMRAANRVAGREVYRWEIVSLDGMAPATSCGLAVPVDGALVPARRRDMLVVLAAFNVLAHATKPVLRAVRTGARHAGMVGGLEAGAWVLGLAGLLDGRAATTHWEDLELFTSRFPAIEVRRDRYVISGRMMTTGGAAPCLDMMLDLIRARHGAELALRVAGAFLYEPLHAPTVPQQALSAGRIGRGDPALGRAIAMMEAAIEQPPSVAEIAAELGLSQRRLEMLFAEKLGTSPGRFFLDLRLDEARRMVTDTRLSMQEIALRTGFSSQMAFARAFRSRFGSTASASRAET